MHRAGSVNQSSETLAAHRTHLAKGIDPGDVAKEPIATHLDRQHELLRGTFAALSACRSY